MERTRWLSLAWILVAPVMPVSAQCAQWDAGFAATPVGPDGEVHAVTVFDAGSGPALHVGGSFTMAGGVSTFHVARWDGTNWSALGPPGSGMNGTVRSLAVFDDGSGPALYAGGEFTLADGAPASRIAKWNGAAWSALAGGTNGTVRALATFDDGTGPALFAAGSFTTAGGISAPHIARWDGTSWSALGAAGSGLDQAAFALCAFDDGTTSALYVGGSFTAAGGLPASRVARWDGTGWSALGAGTNLPVLALAAFDDGSGVALHAAGQFFTAGGAAAAHVAKWSGTGWSALGSGTNDQIWALATHDDGSGPALYAGGFFAFAGGLPASRIARWDGSSWSALGGSGSGANDTVWCLASLDDGSGSALVAGGKFTTVGGFVAQRVARWSGAFWTGVAPYSNGMNGAVGALAVFDDGSGNALYAGGEFTIAGSAPASRIARWDGENWLPLGPFGDLDGAVQALAVLDDGSGQRLYAGGFFTHRVRRWNPGTGTWAALGSGGANDAVWTFAAYDDGSGPALYAGGLFTSIGGVSAARVARWNGTSWSALGAPGSGMNNLVFALAVFDDGGGPALYAGGYFTTAGGGIANRIAKWDGTSWSQVGISGISDAVRCLAVFDDGSGPALYAGGDFAFAGGTPAARIAKWDGVSWSAVGGGLNNPVYAMSVFDDGQGPALIVTGEFSLAGGVPVGRAARWDGTSWSALGDPALGFDNTPLALAAFDDGSDGDLDLYLGGWFTTVDGRPSDGIAQWHGCAVTAVPLCFGDGSGAPCPCTNTGLPGRGCDNSGASGGALLTASGVTTPDTLVLTQQGELASSLSIFLQGSLELASPVVFGDGLRCAGGSLLRLFAHNASGGTVSAPAPGDASISARSAALGDPLALGLVRVYQVYYRDPDLAYCPAPPGNSFNVGNALRVTW